MHFVPLEFPSCTLTLRLVSRKSADVSACYEEGCMTFITLHDRALLEVHAESRGPSDGGYRGTYAVSI